MDKRALERFATSARKELINKVASKAYYYGFKETDITEKRNIGDVSYVGDLMLSSGEDKAWTSLKSKINKENTDNNYKKALIKVIDEVAYTWFNRLIALRFMEVNNYLPTRVKVMSSSDGGVDPDIIRDALNVNLNIDKEKVYNLKQGNKRDELFKYMIIKQCEALQEILPFLFDKTHDYVELLFPDNLLANGAFVENINIAMPDEDCHDVEVIGWLYQYYISERKDEVFAGLRKNKKIQKEDIAPATQLFTPEWIVRYMVQNSLGRLWIEHLQGEQENSGLTFPMTFPMTFGTDNRGRIEKLKSKWKYYLEEAEQEEEVETQLKEIRKESKDKKIEDIKLLDPCMGSGHILVYAFDLLYDIYEEQGYVPQEISQTIIEKNLYGLDIDYRAAQLAYFAVMMKGRSKDKQFFNRNVQPNIYAIEQSNGLNNFEHGVQQLQLDEKFKNIANYIIDTFNNALEYGSLIDVESKDYDGFLEYLERMEKEGFDNIVDQAWYEYLKEPLLIIIEVAKILSAKFDVVCTNPPYMGSNGMNSKLRNYTKQIYPNSCLDLSTIFMEKSLEICNDNGRIAIINIPVWMFLKSYENLRVKLLKKCTFETMLHFGRGVFGSDFGTTGFVIKNYNVYNYIGKYRKLYKKQGAVDSITQKEKWFLKGTGEYNSSQENYSKIPGTPIAYWVSDKFIATFNNETISKHAQARLGMATANNNSFLRNWHEVNNNKIGFSVSDRNEAIGKGYKWFPYNKGGEFRKWYGNRDYVVNWENDGYEIRNFKDKKTGKIRSHNYNLDYIFRKGITWTFLSSSKFSARFFENGFLCDAVGCGLYADNNLINYIQGVLCSNITDHILNVLNPSISYQPGNISSIPLCINEVKKIDIDTMVKTNIEISKIDWNSFETSWDFERHPLLRFGISIHSGLVDYKNISKTSAINTKTEKTNDSFIIIEKGVKFSGLIKTSFRMYSDFTNEKFFQLKSNEEELNRIFIDIYDLAEELTPEVEEKDVTIYRVVEDKNELGYKSNYILERSDVIKSFISYSVGCMLGRYSPYKEGLIFAGGEWNYGKIQDELWDAAGEQIKEKLERSKDGTIVGDFILPDVDNVIPITDEKYFNDDIVGEFIKFVKECFGEETLEENLEFIADSLNPKTNEIPEETIRRYFINDFYKDHVQTYKKRPIYWLFTSGKEKAFNALIYMHRYDKSTLANIRTNYLHKQQSILEARLSRLSNELKIEDNSSERRKIEKEIDKITKQLDEIVKYDEKLHHEADKMIEIDLDDGVVVNYAKFEGLVEEI